MRKIARVPALLALFSYLPAVMAAPAARAASPDMAARLQRKAPGFSLLDDNGEVHGAEFVMRQYPGEKLMAVRVISGVRNPGIYYVPIGSDLLTVISVSGGLAPTADPSKVRWNRWAAQEHRMLDLEESVADPKAKNPTLGANDVLMIEESKPIISNNTLIVITLVASVLGIAVAAKSLAKN